MSYNIPVLNTYLYKLGRTLSLIGIRRQPRGKGGADKRGPHASDSREAGARWTKSTRALLAGAPRGGHGGQRAEVATAWRRGGANAGRHQGGHMDAHGAGAGGRGAAQLKPTRPSHGTVAARDGGERPEAAACIGGDTRERAVVGRSSGWRG